MSKITILLFKLFISNRYTSALVSHQLAWSFASQKLFNLPIFQLATLSTPYMAMWKINYRLRIVQIKFLKQLQHTMVFCTILRPIARIFRRWVTYVDVRCACCNNYMNNCLLSLIQIYSCLCLLLSVTCTGASELLQLHTCHIMLEFLYLYIYSLSTAHKIWPLSTYIQ